MDYKNSLISLGLSRDEALAYTTLLELGPSSPTTVEKHAKMFRPLVYKALDALFSRGLVKITPKGKRRLYVAVSPDKLLELFKNIENSFLSNLEDLHALYNQPKKNRPIITYAEGEEAIRATYLDVVGSLKKGDTYYRYSPGYELFDRARFLPKKYRDMREAKNLERFAILNENGKKYHTKSLSKHVKSVPKSFDLFNDRIGVVIYKDTVAIIDYDSVSSISINHPKFAEFQKKLFKLLYSKL